MAQQQNTCAICTIDLVLHADEPGVLTDVGRNGRAWQPALWPQVQWATVDHLVPRARGGTDVEANLRMVCNRCNMLRGAARRSDHEVLALRVVEEGWPSWFAGAPEWAAA